MPIGGYTQIFERLLTGSDVKLQTDFAEIRHNASKIANQVIYTGCVDEYFNWIFGPLEYRSVRFEMVKYPHIENYQGNAVVNYTGADVPYTRSIEHKHFEYGTQPNTIVSFEYSTPYDHKVNDPSYPINNDRNEALYKKYINFGKTFGKTEPRVFFCGRLGSYKYMDMDVTVRAALDLSRRLFDRQRFAF